MVQREMGEMARHERAVARSLGFAEAAAGDGDFVNAVGWLRVVEAVDGNLPEKWQRALADWADRERPGEQNHRAPIDAPETGAAGRGADPGG